MGARSRFAREVLRAIIAKSSYQPTCPIPQSALLTAQRKVRPKGCLYKGAFILSSRPTMTKPDTRDRDADLVIFVFIIKFIASAEKSALAFFCQVQYFLKTHANLYCKFKCMML